VKHHWIYAAFPVLTLPVLAVSVAAPSAMASDLTFSMPVQHEPMRLAQAVEYGGLPPYEIVTIVRSAGLDPIDRPVRRGPNYVLHAIGQDDQEVRVIVGARRGEIIRIVPIMAASRMPPARGGVAMGPYERMDGYEPARPAPSYVAPGGYRTGARPPAPDDDDDESYNDAPRPPAAVPGAAPRPGYAPSPPRTGYAEPPPVIRATPSGRGSDISRGTDLPPPSGARAATAYPPPPRSGDLPPPSGSRAASAYPPRSTDLPPPSDPRATTAPGPGRDGLLPPPPERFPQRVAPAAEKAKDAPKPVKRAAATAGPKPTPMPKPKPSTPASATAPSAPPATPATPAPEAAKDTAKEAAKEITKTPEPSAPAAETKPAAEPQPSADKPADNAVPH
jgi:hypothetical protein